MPVQVDQLFVLMIDSSALTNEVDGKDGLTRMDKVKALLMKSVQSFFFQRMPRTGLRFNFTEEPVPLGGTMKLLSSKKNTAVSSKNTPDHRKDLRICTEWLYAAVDFLEKSEIQRWLTYKMLFLQLWC